MEKYEPLLTMLIIAKPPLLASLRMGFSPMRISEGLCDSEYGYLFDKGQKNEENLLLIGIWVSKE